MRKVLIAIGTTGLDVHDVCDEIHSQVRRRAKEPVECIVKNWNEIVGPAGQYDLAVLYGLDEHYKKKGHLFAKTVRHAIGPTTKFLIIPGWNKILFDREMMGEMYDAAYLSRGNFVEAAIVILEMLAEAKTAP